MEEHWWREAHDRYDKYMCLRWSHPDDETLDAPSLEALPRLCQYSSPLEP